MQALENAEYRVVMFRWNPNTIVANVINVPLRLLAKSNFDPSVELIVIFRGICDEVLEHFANERPIAVFHRQGTRNTNLDIQLRKANSKRFGDIPQDLVQV